LKIFKQGLVDLEMILNRDPNSNEKILSGVWLKFSGRGLARSRDSTAVSRCSCGKIPVDLE
jgi:hypothetical protein